MEAALYDPDEGFFATGRGAGRSDGDFITSPQVGSLFGTCVARAIDRLWHALGEPDPFLVVEAGAGNGRLARDIVRAGPECSAALRYVLVERSRALRLQQRELLDLEPADEALGPFVRARGDEPPVPAPGAGPVVASLDELPAVEADGVVVFANELLDNLPFGVVEWDGARWQEVRVGLGPDGTFSEVLVQATDDDAAGVTRDVDGRAIAAGRRLPLHRGAATWLHDCDRVVRRGYVVLVDYFVTMEELLARDRPGGWLRTYRAHQVGTDALEFPGSQDITTDVVVEQFHRLTELDELYASTQADWLRELGIDHDVEAGEQVWRARAHLGDLDALRGRSRVSEAAALTDPAGLGAHRVRVLGRRVPDWTAGWPR